MSRVESVDAIELGSDYRNQFVKLKRKASCD